MIFRDYGDDEHDGVIYFSKEVISMVKSGMVKLKGKALSDYKKQVGQDSSVKKTKPWKK